MEIKKATLDDVKDISRIHALSWKFAYKGIVPQDYLDEIEEDFWVSMFADCIKNNDLIAQLIFENHAPIGCISYGKSRDEKFPHWGEIVSLYLLPEYFGKEYGDKLLESALFDLRQSGCQNVYLWVLKENQRARHFYEKNNWKCTKDRCIYQIRGKQLIEVRYIYSPDK
jgi:ribosomal protein S18 acetylase RimI-like enzyme